MISCTVSGMAKTIADEIERREIMWDLLQGQPADQYKPDELRSLGVYGGAQGIWVDKEETASLVEDGCGIAVGLLHTGTHYDDLWGDSGLAYMYPSTERLGTRDTNEVNALKNAARYKVPVFIIRRPSRSSNTREVQVGWVIECSDAAKAAWVSFDPEADPITLLDETDDVFQLTKTGRPPRYSSTVQREGQSLFRYRVLKRYGARCLFTGIDHASLIDACHICGHSYGGSNHPGNGIPLSATVHRAFDSHLIRINPESYLIEDDTNGTTLRMLGIDPSALANETVKPNQEAIRWRWENTQ
ncbi:MAG: HNH endonuclease [Phycisphaera sp.]|nr:MAG: HNH endonuclease [Phycisphaera sp.]